MAVPTTINELKARMKEFGVSNEDLEKFQEELDDADHDIESIKEDISDQEQSLLLDFFREKLDAKEKVYDYIKAILYGKQQPHEPIPNVPIPDEPMPPIPIQTNESEEKQMLIPDDPHWEYQREAGNDGDGTVILNAGLVIIPDEVITNEKYLEQIDGISYVLSYNNAMTTPPRLPYSYVEFWHEYIDEDQPRYKQIADDIQHNEGPTYDYLMEHPPNDRILPVLEKVVDQLKYPCLDSQKNKRSVKTYEAEIDTFFKQQTPDYDYMLDGNCDLKKTCVLFKKNTNDANFNTFELMIPILDIYDRILYANKWNITQPKQITDTRDIDGVKHHFARKLDEEDCNALNATMGSFKEEKQSFFKRLHDPTQEHKINGNVRDFQLISLSFILFVKAFMCETGNCLERGYHSYKAPRRQRRSANKGFVPVVESLMRIKKDREKKENVFVDDGDIFFHNDNMPLQFDLCIIVKGDNGHKYYANYGLEQKQNKNAFVIESATFQTPTDRDSVYKLYGDFVKVFRRVIRSNNIESVGKKIHIRKDDRFCIVMDENVQKFYMYPPHFKKNGKITHKRHKNVNNVNKIYKKEEKSVDNDDNDIDNKFSLIPMEYNDITNFYLTSKCLIPSKTTGEYYGMEGSDINFVFSAHFHQQRQWHRHPKLRFYQYFNGGALRFLYKADKINNYECDKDLIHIWPKFFVHNTGIDEKFIADCEIFDGVMDVYKCDAQYFQFDNAVKRQLVNIKIDQIEAAETETMHRMTMINSICKALGRYYKSKNKPYDELFSVYCEESDIDDTDLAAEFAEAADCILIDFDADFPCDASLDADKKAKFIFKTVKQCYKNPFVTFTVDIPQFNEKFFELTQRQLDETKAFYKLQCPKIYDRGMEQDRAFMTLLAVGRKNNFEYVQHLVDDYFRAKVQHINNEAWDKNKWIQSHHHFAHLATIGGKVLNESTPYDLAMNAVQSFSVRCCPQLVFDALAVIDDDIEASIRYIESVTVLIANVFDIASGDKTQRAVCPFQIDLCLAAGKAKQLNKTVEFSGYEDDDDDDDEKSMHMNGDDDWIDCIGNIENKLKQNKLQYQCAEMETGRKLKIFTKLFTALENRSVAENEWFYNLHRKRMVAFVDRRSSKNEQDVKDTVYMFQPPANSSNIPSDACGLWYISASRTCLLPDMKYGNGCTEKERDTKNTAKKLLEANITSGFHCKAGLLTISFHVKSKDEVKMYLYFMGQIIRFMPEDITTLFPLLFNMDCDFADNRGFIANRNEIDPIISNIRKVIKDAYFDAFQYSYQR